MRTERYSIGRGCTKAVGPSVLKKISTLNYSLVQCTYVITNKTVMLKGNYYAVITIFKIGMLNKMFLKGIHPRLIFLNKIDPV